MCPKVSGKNGNATTKKIDKALLQKLHSHGLNDVEIAAEVGCSKQAVAKARKRLELESNYEQKVDEQLLIMLNTMGMDDGSIAKEMGCTRRAITAARERLNLPSCRKRGERGLGWWQGTYYEAVLEAMKDPIIARHIYRAARELYKTTNDEHTAWAATIVEPLALMHPAPQIAGQADKIYPLLVKRIGQYELAAARAGVVGVPGPAILEIFRQKDAVNPEQREIFMEHLAQKAVGEAGYINENVTVEQVVESGVKPIPATVWHSIWSAYAEMAVAWAPAPNPEPKTRIPESWKRKERLTQQASGTGRKGKGGGIKSLDKSIAMSGVNRA